MELLLFGLSRVVIASAPMEPAFAADVLCIEGDRRGFLSRAFFRTLAISTIHRLPPGKLRTWVRDVDIVHLALLLLSVDSSSFFLVLCCTLSRSYP